MSRRCARRKECLFPCNYTTQDFYVYPIYSRVLGFCISDFWSLVYYIFMSLKVSFLLFLALVLLSVFSYFILVSPALKVFTCTDFLGGCATCLRLANQAFVFLLMPSLTLHWVISLRLHVFFPFPVSKLISDHLPKGYSWCSWMYFQVSEIL